MDVPLRREWDFRARVRRRSPTNTRPSCLSCMGSVCTPWQLKSSEYLYRIAEFIANLPSLRWEPVSSKEEPQPLQAAVLETVVPLTAAFFGLLCFLLCLLRGPFCRFSFCALPGSFFLGRFFRRLFLSRLFLRRRFLFGSGLFGASTTAPGGSSGFGLGCGRRRSRGHHGLTHFRLGHARFFLLLLFLFEILFQRLAVGAGVAEFFFVITCVKCGIVRHCSS